LIRILIFCQAIVVAAPFLYAQQVEIVPKKTDDNQIQIFIKNGTKQAHSVELDCELKGMKASDSLPITLFIPPNGELSFVKLKPIDIYKAHSYATSIRYVVGDVSAVHNDSTIYYLPFPKGKKYRVDQGYLGTKTHQNQYALDFNMDEGAEIAAIRSGVVTKVVENNDRGCPSESCTQFNNYILITHKDGSIADYSHLRKNGAKVKVGDEVNVGDVIALSGATGWASGAHLHLEVYTMTWEGQKTIPVNYYLDKEKNGVPEEGQGYTQLYSN
jgi:murein DD-endopeptidase MepM/ murein hydrolase activator NlpD